MLVMGKDILVKMQHGLVLIMPFQFYQNMMWKTMMN